MLDSFLRGVTKDSYGPITFTQGPTATQPGFYQGPAVVHKFHDAFSMYRWGKMPDSLPERGKANTFVFAHLNQLVQSPTAWKEYLRSPEALAFRKAASAIPQTMAPVASMGMTAHLSSMLNEISESFSTHHQSNYLGLITDDVYRKLTGSDSLTHSQCVDQANAEVLNFNSMLYPVCEYFTEEKIPVSTVMGRAVWDYSIWKKQAAPKLIPFEIHCDFEASKAAFPAMDLVLGQQSFLKKITASEALWITEWTPDQLQELYLRAAWIASFVRNYGMKNGMELKALPLRFGVDSRGKFVLVDSLALEDLMPLNELDEFYKKTQWFESVERAQTQALGLGYSEWKRLCTEPAPWLDSKVKEASLQSFRNAANAWLGKTGLTEKTCS